MGTLQAPAGPNRTEILRLNRRVTAKDAPPSPALVLNGRIIPGVCQGFCGSRRKPQRSDMKSPAGTPYSSSIGVSGWLSVRAATLHFPEVPCWVGVATLKNERDLTEMVARVPVEQEAKPVSAATRDRRLVVESARERWIKRLIDLSRRNNLLYYRTLKTGSLDLQPANSPSVGKLVLGESVALVDLLPPLVRRDSEDDLTFRQRNIQTQLDAAAKLREIQRRALANLEEKGLETLFVAVGMATWPSEDGGTPTEAPVLLVPLDVKRRGRADVQLRLQRAGDVQLNPVLAYVLEERGCLIDEEALLDDLNASESQSGSEADPADLVKQVFDRLAVMASPAPGFSITSRVVVGNFHFHKMAMVKDLEQAGELMASNDLIAALAGWEEAKVALSRSEPDDPLQLDQIAPEDEYLVLNADSSQQAAIQKVLLGASGVIQGPPGTGKSQTIANLIAELAARGKRVLFVAEKRAALEAVYRRLQDVGLGHLALDLHGASISRKEIVARIGAALEEVRNSLPVPGDGLYSRFRERRLELNQHVDRLHRRRTPSGKSVYEIQGALLALPNEVHSHVRWKGEDLDRFTPDVARHVEDLLKELGDLEEYFLETSASPWVKARLRAVEDVQKAQEVSGRLAHDILQQLHLELDEWSSETGLAEPQTVDDLRDLVSLLVGIEQLLARYESRLFEADLGTIIEVLQPARKGLLKRMFAWIGRRAYREARRLLHSLSSTKRASTAQLLADAEAARNLLEAWRARTGPTSLPVLTRNVQLLADLVEALERNWNELRAFFPATHAWPTTLSELEQYFQRLATDRVSPYRIQRVAEIVSELESLGVGSLLSEIRRSERSPGLWPGCFRYAWLHSCLDRAHVEDPELAAFQGSTHSRKVEEFIQLDRARIHLAARRVRRIHAERVTQARNEYPDQDLVVRREVGKKQRHMPLRRLLAQAPDVLLALFPCWMASPLSVSQVLGLGQRYFDVVIFDEASQITPEDAVPSLMRAQQVVAAGDSRQLPPTLFFADQSFSEEQDEHLSEETSGFESLLDQLASFLPNWSLKWHYRSRDERLIAFSNRYMYNDQLVTFPGIGGYPAVQHVLVDQPLGLDGQEDSVSAEVEKVVQLVLEHARTRPDESLGVITMGIKHARRIEHELDDKLKAAFENEPELDDFFDPDKEERFFVKNLERVQGDERDAIILSIGYGKDRTGRLPYRFGPLLYEGGERRLNVAITRAKKRMTVVSSFSHWDMPEDRSKARGVVLLRKFLEYAASGGTRLGDIGPTDVELNEFEQDVYEALTANGMRLVPQYGVSRYRIDFAACHPQQEGRYVLAIECDGASYHSEPTARDRDRLRQQHLEELGWRFHRIWSTDWFMNRRAEIDRAVKAYWSAVRSCDSGDRSGEPTQQQTMFRLSNGPEPASPVLGQRGPRPYIPVRQQITEYTDGELDRLMHWLLSDGRPRTDEELIRAAMAELGFKRRGKRIDEALRQSLERVRKARRRS